MRAPPIGDEHEIARLRAHAAPPCFVAHSPDRAKARKHDAARPGQEAAQPLHVAGALRIAVAEFAHHAARHLRARLRRFVKVGAVHLFPFQMALLLEDIHHRHHRGVGDAAALQERGHLLGSGAHLRHLRRTAVAPFTIAVAL